MPPKPSTNTGGVGGSGGGRRDRSSSPIKGPGRGSGSPKKNTGQSTGSSPTKSNTSAALSSSSTSGRRRDQGSDGAPFRPSESATASTAASRSRSPQKKVVPEIQTQLPIPIIRGQGGMQSAQPPISPSATSGPIPIPGAVPGAHKAVLSQVLQEIPTALDTKLTQPVEEPLSPNATSEPIPISKIPNLLRSCTKDETHLPPRNTYASALNNRQGVPDGGVSSSTTLPSGTMQKPSTSKSTGSGVSNRGKLSQIGSGTSPKTKNQGGDRGTSHADHTGLGRGSQRLFGNADFPHLPLTKGTHDPHKPPKLAPPPTTTDPSNSFGLLGNMGSSYPSDKQNQNQEDTSTKSPTPLSQTPPIDPNDPFLRFGPNRKSTIDAQTGSSGASNSSLGASASPSALSTQAGLLPRSSTGRPIATDSEGTEAALQSENPYLPPTDPHTALPKGPTQPIPIPKSNSLQDSKKKSLELNPHATSAVGASSLPSNVFEESNASLSLLPGSTPAAFQPETGAVPPAWPGSTFPNAPYDPNGPAPPGQLRRRRSAVSIIDPKIPGKTVIPGEDAGDEYHIPGDKGKQKMTAKQAIEFAAANKEAQERMQADEARFAELMNARAATGSESQDPSQDEDTDLARAITLSLQQVMDERKKTESEAEAAAKPLSYAAALTSSLRVAGSSSSAAKGKMAEGENNEGGRRGDQDDINAQAVEKKRIQEAERKTVQEIDKKRAEEVKIMSAQKEKEEQNRSVVAKLKKLDEEWARQTNIETTPTPTPTQQGPLEVPEALLVGDYEDEQEERIWIPILPEPTDQATLMESSFFIELRATPIEKYTALVNEYYNTMISHLRAHGTHSSNHRVKLIEQFLSQTEGRVDFQSREARTVRKLQDALSLLQTFANSLSDISEDADTSRTQNLRFARVTRAMINGLQKFEETLLSHDNYIEFKDPLEREHQLSRIEQVTEQGNILIQQLKKRAEPENATEDALKNTRRYTRNPIHRFSGHSPASYSPGHFMLLEWTRKESLRRKGGIHIPADQGKTTMPSQPRWMKQEPPSPLLWYTPAQILQALVKVDALRRCDAKVQDEQQAFYKLLGAPFSDGSLEELVGPGWEVGWDEDPGKPISLWGPGRIVDCHWKNGESKVYTWEHPRPDLQPQFELKLPLGTGAYPGQAMIHYDYIDQIWENVGRVGWYVFSAEMNKDDDPVVKKEVEQIMAGGGVAASLVQEEGHPASRARVSANAILQMGWVPREQRGHVQRRRSIVGQEPLDPTDALDPDHPLPENIRPTPPGPMSGRPGGAGRVDPRPPSESADDDTSSSGGGRSQVTVHEVTHWNDDYNSPRSEHTQRIEDDDSPTAEHIEDVDTTPSSSSEPRPRRLSVAKPTPLPTIPDTEDEDSDDGDKATKGQPLPLPGDDDIGGTKLRRTASGEIDPVFKAEYEAKVQAALKARAGANKLAEELRLDDIWKQEKLQQDKRKRDAQIWKSKVHDDDDRKKGKSKQKNDEEEEDDGTKKDEDRKGKSKQRDDEDDTDDEESENEDDDGKGKKKSRLKFKKWWRNVTSKDKWRRDPDDDDDAGASGATTGGGLRLGKLGSFSFRGKRGSGSKSSGGASGSAAPSGNTANYKWSLGDDYLDEVAGARPKHLRPAVNIGRYPWPEELEELSSDSDENHYGAILHYNELLFSVYPDLYAGSRRFREERKYNSLSVGQRFAKTAPPLVCFTQRVTRHARGGLMDLYGLDETNEVD